MEKYNKRENLTQNKITAENDVPHTNIELLDLIKNSTDVRVNKLILGISEKGNRFTTKKILINKEIIEIDEH